MRALLLVCALASVAAAESPPKAEPSKATGAAKAAPVVEKSRVEVQPAGTPFKQLAIENPLGDIKVEGHDGSSS